MHETSLISGVGGWKKFLEITNQEPFVNNIALNLDL